jgi:Ca2+-binding RTX toxin-like protein
MSIYNVTFDLVGVFSGGVPQLTSLYGNVDFSTDYAYASATSVSFDIDTDAQPFDTTLLRFFFDGANGLSGDTIQVTNLKIDGATVGGGGTTIDYGDAFDIDVGYILTDTQFSPPDPNAGVNAVVTGTAGNDYLEGTPDADTINGLGGNDRINGGADVDTINGGDGDDRIIGGIGNDFLNGDNNNDTIYGGDGADTITGGEGNDALYGNAGNNTISGGNGADRIDGGINNDILNGDGGADVIYGGAGTDTINGGDGNDRLGGNDGVDTIHGNNDNDDIRGGNGNDFLYGDAGDDNIDGQGDDDTIEGGAGSDTISGDRGNDNIDGGTENDYLNGGQGADTINGGTGDDIIYGGGMQTYDQYNIRDASAFGTAGVWFNEQTQSFYTLVTSGNNWIQSNTAAQAAVLNGVNGHLVTITSQTELDYLLSATGVDSYWVDGGDYTNEGAWRSYSGADSGAQYYSESGVGAVNNYSDLFAAGQPNNGSTENYAYLYSVDSGIADSGLTGFAHSVGYIIEWDAEDIMADLSANILNGDAGNDTIYGGGGIDTVSGGADNDRIYGNAGNDVLNGDGGNDFIKGGSGNDAINGDAGNDVLYGGDYVEIRFLDAADIKAYGNGQDGGGTTTILDDGIGVEFDDNAWKFLEVNYNVTSNTVVEFDFRSTSEAEISGIGFDNDLNIDSNATFKVYGTQTWGRSNYDNYDGSGNWTHYEIDVGNFYTGQFSYFFFVNDDDGGPANNAFFRNIFIHEGDNGNNTLSGGAGLDDLYGGGGIDTFVFEAASAFVNTDRVHNFEGGDGDIIDLSDIITGFTGTVTDHVQIVDSGDHAILSVDADGAGGYTNVAEIWGGEGLDVATLYAAGQIIV